MESAALPMKWEHCCAPAVQTDQDDATSMKSGDCLLRQDLTRCRLVPAAIIYR